MTDAILRRILARAPELLDVLRGLSGADLTSLLLALSRERAEAITPARLVRRYRQDRFVRPSRLDPRTSCEIESMALGLLGSHTTPLQLSPLTPLGTCAAVATVDQNKVVSTVRGTEVVADSTNVLALECAVRRRELLRETPSSKARVRLAAAQRLVRAQALAQPWHTAHFGIFCLATAGRAENGYRFEHEELVAQVAFHVRLLRAVRRARHPVGAVRAKLTPMGAGAAPMRIATAAAERLADQHPDVTVELDFEREQGRNYYRTAAFFVTAEDADGVELPMADGGFTDWTATLLADRKERLLVSGIGTDLIGLRLW